MYTQYADDIKRICLQKGFAINIMGLSDGYPVYRIDINPSAKINICIVAGIHGDETSGPLGLLEFLRITSIRDVHIILFPVLNPYGFDKGKYTTKNDINLNRVFLDDPLPQEAQDILNSINKEKISWFISLHEDDEMDGFYIYKYSKYEEPTERIINFLSKQGPICSSRKIYGNDSINGIISNQKSDGSLEEKMYKEGIPVCICVEMPDVIKIEKRTQIICDLMVYLCSVLKSPDMSHTLISPI